MKWSNAAAFCAGVGGAAYAMVVVVVSIGPKDWPRWWNVGMSKISNPLRPVLKLFLLIVLTIATTLGPGGGKVNLPTIGSFGAQISNRMIKPHNNSISRQTAH